jgi:hypothetical protein
MNVLILVEKLKNPYILNPHLNGIVIFALTQPIQNYVEQERILNNIDIRITINKRFNK